MVKSYITKEYTEIPKNSIVAIVSAIAYVLTPVDLIPDFLFGGMIDDVAVVAFCLKLVEKDIANYRAWREANAPATAEEQEVIDAE